ncbi:hypothetical protein GTG28_08100 [Vibrio sp. OCN044]|uniref:Uncharacterized protein n=1 Tax=Vibrio tetraodonis subsp. pristinus TaxID=2695891 RepID=A0A6L8LUM3_9VIBR|nr:RebB family R body protein [Vibrio tetraodonis]MYM59183.1 hypothetical protein [Vibrio tetraodonis subsp. pristinus]
MTVRGSTYLENETKTIEVIAGEQEPAVVTFIPTRRFDSAMLTIEMKGDLGHNNEFIDLYVNGNKAESLTTHNHDKTYQTVFKCDISQWVLNSRAITLEFMPTRYVNKLWGYAWAANITLSLSGFEVSIDGGELVEMLTPAAASANQMVSIGHALSTCAQTASLSQQHTMSLQFTSNTLGVQTIMSIGTGVGGMVAGGLIGGSD